MPYRSQSAGEDGMTRIALIRFDSGKHDREEFARDRSRFLAPLRREFRLEETEPGAVAADDRLPVVFIASGGSEAAFRRHFHRLARPIVLLADGRHNSLPAALEIASWVRRQGEKAEIVHGRPGGVIQRLRELARYHAARRALAGRIGVIGRPSDWLIGSAVDRAAVKRRWGTEVVDVPLAQLRRLRGGGAAAAAFAGECVARARALDGVDETAVRSAAQLLPALKALFVRHRLRAATLRCFSLFGPFATSGCLALSRLNSEGWFCGCEGDVPAAFSMLLLHALTGEAPFLANPAEVDPQRNELVMAHCTVPERAVRGYRLQTHFETGLGVALCGSFPLGMATVFKAGGPELDRYFVSAAEVLPSRPRPGLCRTQVRLRLREDAGYFLRASLANHHLLVAGDHAQGIDGFMRYFGALRIRG